VNTPQQGARPVDSRVANGEMRDYMQRGPLVPSAPEAGLEPVPEERRILAILGEADEPSHGARAPWIRVTGSVFMGEVKVVVRERGT
jgi:hypothetical protein